MEYNKLFDAIKKEFSKEKIILDFKNDSNGYTAIFKGFLKSIEEDCFVLVNFKITNDIVDPRKKDCLMLFSTGHLYKGQVGSSTGSLAKEYNDKNVSLIPNGKLFFNLEEKSLLYLACECNYIFTEKELKSVTKKAQDAAKKYLKQIMKNEEVKKVFDMAATESTILSYLF